jgi:hypothetical protein
MPQGSEEVMSVLNDKTKVSLGLAIALIGGGAMWLSSVSFRAESALAQTQENKTEIAAVKADQKSDRVVQYQMATDIAVIKTLLESRKGK